MILKNSLSSVSSYLIYVYIYSSIVLILTKLLTLCDMIERQKQQTTKQTNISFTNGSIISSLYILKQ